MRLSDTIGTLTKFVDIPQENASAIFENTRKAYCCRNIATYDAAGNPHRRYSHLDAMWVYFEKARVK